MSPKTPTYLMVAALLSLTLIGCERDLGELVEAELSTEPDVLLDGFGPHIDFQAFANTNFDAVDIDFTTRAGGDASVVVTVLEESSGPPPWFAGGAFVSGVERNLTGYNALIFQVRASEVATLDVVGIGNDNTGTSLFEASRSSIPVDTTWKTVLIPIPNADRLTNEKGMFYFADDASDDDGNVDDPDGGGYTLWFDEMEFTTASNVSNPRPILVSGTETGFVGGQVPVETYTTYDIDGEDVRINHQPGYFTFTSSDPDVATVDESGIRMIGGGTTTVTAKLGDVDAEGTVTLEVIGAPVDPAPTPSHDPGDVISVFSDQYADVPVHTFLAFSNGGARVEELPGDGNAVLAYTDLQWAGISIDDPGGAPPVIPIDATDMEFFHVDVWVDEGVSRFGIKLVDFGANGVFDGQWPANPNSDDREHELIFDANSTPALVNEGWTSLDIPLSDFTTIGTRTSIAQIIVISANNTAFVDNIYFHK